MLRILAFLISFSAYADDCHNRNGMSDYRDLIHQAAVVGVEGRRTEEKYAAEKSLPLISVQNRFAATGTIDCNGIRATAQLTGATNVITTAAHVFYKEGTCVQDRKPDACTFTVKVGGRTQTSRIKSAKAIGFNCPEEANRLDDWAVLTLEQDLNDINPYELPQSSEIVRDRDQIISVSAGATDFTVVDPKTRKKIMPKTIDDCEVKRTIVYDVMAKFESDCDLGRGGSGGGVLMNRNGKDVLMGISVSNNASPAQDQEAIRIGKTLSAPYSPNTWATYHIPLNGRFLKAVERAMQGNSI